jgi:hypothetical protein
LKGVNLKRYDVCTNVMLVVGYKLSNVSEEKFASTVRYEGYAK